MCFFFQKRNHSKEENLKGERVNNPILPFIYTELPFAQVASFTHRAAISAENRHTSRGRIILKLYEIQLQFLAV